jgi:glycerate kinase
MAFLTRSWSGALVVDSGGFDRAMPGADLVIPRRRPVDGQTAFGKAPGEVAHRAAAAGIPVLLIAGSKGKGWETLTEKGVNTIQVLAEEGDNLRDLMQDPAPALTQAAARAVREMLGPK